MLNESNQVYCPPNTMPPYTYIYKRHWLLNQLHRNMYTNSISLRYACYTEQTKFKLTVQVVPLNTPSSCAQSTDFTLLGM